MIMKVLQDKSQIRKGRQELVRKGVSQTEKLHQKLLRKLKLIRTAAIGDKVKSWDVLTSVNFLEENVEKNAPILDIGCYASEVVIALYGLEFSNLFGVDLNKDLGEMPYQNDIHYEISNFMHTPFENASFQAITSISVIEHGFKGVELLKEISRLLKPGGYFLASFDYWPEKVDTKGIKFFGMDWLIFSQKDVENFINCASKYGLTPVGKMNYEAKERAINYAGFDYTFGWLVLTKVN